MTVDCKAILSAFGDLPPTPVVALKVVRLMGSPWVSAKALADAIAHDSAISARILGAANSPLFFTGQKVATVQQAIVALGDTLVRNLVLEASMRSINKSFGLMERTLWEESIGCALGAKMLADRFQAGDPEEALFAGLFHNLGKVVMNNHSRDAYGQVVEAVERGGGPLEEIERTFFSFTHQEIGAAVLEKWSFAPSLVLTTLHYGDLALPADASPDIRRFAAVVNVAASLCRHFGIGGNGRAVETDLALLPGAAVLNIGPAQLEEVLDEFYAGFEKDLAMFLA